MDQVRNPPSLGRAHPTLEAVAWQATASTAREGLPMVDAEMQTDLSCTEAVIGFVGTALGARQVAAWWTAMEEKEQLNTTNARQLLQATDQLQQQQQQQQQLNRQEGDNASRQKPNCEEDVNRRLGDNASRQKPNC